MTGSRRKRDSDADTDASSQGKGTVVAVDDGETNAPAVATALLPARGRRANVYTRRVQWRLTTISGVNCDRQIYYVLFVTDTNTRMCVCG